jgi:hypothetical protein
MKKLLIIFIVFLSITFFFGQIYGQSKPFKFGIRGKYNMADVTENLSGFFEVEVEGFTIPVSLDQKMYNTFGFGGFVEYWFNPMFALQVNAQYNMKGTKAEGDIDYSTSYAGFPLSITGNAEGTVKFSYLSFPILGKLAFGNEGAIRPYLVAGPELGFVLSAKVKSEGNATAEFMGMTESASANEEIDIKDEVESVEFALDFGGGLLFPVGGNLDIFVDAQYSAGLTKVNKTGSDDVKNKVIYINLGIVF